MLCTSQVNFLPPSYGARVAKRRSLRFDLSNPNTNATTVRAFRCLPSSALRAKIGTLLQTRSLSDLRPDNSTTSPNAGPSLRLSTEDASPPATSAAPATGTLFGAIALITGSTVGAGMLALPEVTAPAGFLPTAAGLTATWMLLAAEALLMAEVNLELLQRAKPQDAGKIVTLRQMAQRTLGKSGKVVTVIYLLLSYCLLVAYLAKSSEVLDFLVGDGITLPPATAASVLCASTAALLLVGGTSAADRVNQVFTSVLFALFIVILGAGIAQNDIIGSLSSTPSSWHNLTPAIPIIFLSLVYHDLVPFICHYLGGDRKLVRSALILGSLVPLGMFLSWEAVALSLVPGSLIAAAVDPGTMDIQQVSLTTAANGDAMISSAATAATVAGESITGAMQQDAPGLPLTIDPLQVFVRRSGPGIGLAVQSFSFLAVITSFTGTVMGLSETIRSEVPPLVRKVGRFLGSDELSSYDGSTAVAIASADSSDGEDSETDGTPVGGFCTDPGRALALIFALGPPLAFTAQNPGAFLSVLSVAGGYGMTALYGVMPPLMAWKLREQLESKKGIGVVETDLIGKYTLQRSPENSTQLPPSSTSNLNSSLQQGQCLMPGGVPVLAGVLAAATGVGLSRVAQDADGALQALSKVGAEAADLMSMPAAVEVASNLAAAAPM